MSAPLPAVLRVCPRFDDHACSRTPYVVNPGAPEDQVRAVLTKFDKDKRSLSVAFKAVTTFNFALVWTLGTWLAGGRIHSQGILVSYGAAAAMATISAGVLASKGVRTMINLMLSYSDSSADVPALEVTSALARPLGRNGEPRPSCQQLRSVNSRGYGSPVHWALWDLTVLRDTQSTLDAALKVWKSEGVSEERLSEAKEQGEALSKAILDAHSRLADVTSDFTANENAKTVLRELKIRSDAGTEDGQSAPVGTVTSQTRATHGQ